MISIILPTYNERDNIIPLMDSIDRTLHDKKINPYEIIVVDDNSPDGTSEEVKKYSKKNKKIRLITRKKERGLGSAIKTGIDESKGDYIVIMDTDFSHPPEFLKELINTINGSNLDVVIASRYVKGGEMNAERYKFLLSKALNCTLKIILNIKIKDLTGGYFIIKKSLLNKVNLDNIFKGYGDYFFRLFYKLKKEKYSFREIPFRYERRKYGKSKTKILEMGIKYIKTTILLRLKK